jgi:signal transduction histidine kinase
VLRVPADVLRDRSNAWFPFGGHLIQGLYRTARSIESTARQRESLVTLGTLAAGLAHEINNPASAAARAVDDLETACAALVTSMDRLARDELSAGQFAALEGLRREVAPATGDLDPLARAGELNQVWTNLIDNAVDAMDGVGILRVATRAEAPRRHDRHRLPAGCDRAPGPPSRTAAPSRLIPPGPSPARCRCHISNVCSVERVGSL